VKNKAYFKRFQVKYRRRREGKTDYRARRQMVLQDKTKFGAPKYRLVTRLTNKDVIAQIVASKLPTDQVVAAAYSHELPQYGITAGLTNYAAAYATGLLLARRTLAKLGIADKFPGVKAITGEYVKPRDKADDESEDRFPFKAILDVGLARTTTGARIFGVMKGAVDGGINVPHKPNRFPGFDKKKGELDAKILRARIFGGHVSSYLKQVKETAASNPDEKTTQFSSFFKQKLTPEGLEGMYKKAHDEIRKDPLKKKAKKAVKPGQRKVFGSKRKTAEVRRADASKKVEALRKKLSAKK